MQTIFENTVEDLDQFNISRSKNKEKIEQDLISKRTELQDLQSAIRK